MEMSDLNKESAGQATQQRGYSANYVLLAVLFAMLCAGFVVHLVDDHGSDHTVCVIHDYGMPSVVYGNQNPSPTTNRPSERDILFGQLADHWNIPVFVGRDSSVYQELRIYVVNNTSAYGDGEIDRITTNMLRALEMQEGRSLDQVPTDYQVTLWPRMPKGTNYVPDPHVQQLPVEGTPQPHAPETHAPQQPETPSLPSVIVPPKSAPQPKAPSTPNIGRAGVPELVYAHC